MSADAREATTMGPVGQLAPRVDAIDWERVYGDLDGRGNGLIEALLTATECESLAALYAVDGLFRRRVIMERHSYGRGEYQYFAYPLPDAVAALRTLSVVGTDRQPLARGHAARCSILGPARGLHRSLPRRREETIGDRPPFLSVNRLAQETIGDRPPFLSVNRLAETIGDRLPFLSVNRLA